MSSLKAYQKKFEASLKALVSKQSPRGLYAPIDYLLTLGGKRLRPVLVLMTSDVFGGYHDKAIPAALAVEVFHNFTLMHDDIMDAAPLRRGATTVHLKWNLNTAILSGDVMLIQAYQFLEGYEDPLFGKLTRLLNTTAKEVCEGQQYDMDFETQSDVGQESYLNMIRLKTAVLVGCSLKMGALIGGASDSDAQLLYDFGMLLGTAFQIQDDYLDAFGDTTSFGKQVGGDIIENKKTILFHQAVINGNTEQRQELKAWFSEETTIEKSAQKIEAVTLLFNKTGAADASKALVVEYTQAAFQKLEALEISQKGKELFKTFGLNLMERKF